MCSSRRGRRRSSCWLQRWWQTRGSSLGGGVGVEYLPHSYDATRHFPMDVGEEYQSDVYFYGTWWPERGKLMESLRAHNNGYQFKIGGAPPAGDGGELERGEREGR